MGRRGLAEGEGPFSSWPLSPHSHLTLIYWILLINKKPEEMKVGEGGEGDFKGHLFGPKKACKAVHKITNESIL